MTSPLSYVQYTVTDATDLTYSYTLSVLQSSHLAVYQRAVGGNWTEITDFTVSGTEGAYVITLGGSVTLTVGDTLWIGRETPKTNATRLVDFNDGDGLTASDLDTSALQNLYVAQEAQDLAHRAITLGDPADGGDETYSAGGYRLSDLGAPTLASDAVRLSDLQAVSLTAGNLPTPTAEQEASMLVIKSSVWTVRTNGQVGADLGLGLAAYRNIGTGSSDVIPTLADADARYLTAAGNLTGLSSNATARTNLGLGTAATGTFGTSAYNAIQLDANARLPAVDGRNLDLSNNAINAGRSKGIAVLSFTTGAIATTGETTVDIPSIPYAYINSAITVSGATDYITVANQGGVSFRTNIMVRNTGVSTQTGIYYVKLRKNSDTTPVTLWTSENIQVPGGQSSTFSFDYVASNTNPTVFDYRMSGSTNNLRLIYGQAIIDALS